MRALAIGILALAGCGATDPCNGQSGTCVTVTVSSSHISRLDDLELTASGVVTGPRSSKTGSESLPIKLALHLPATASGTLSLSVIGELAGNVEGSGQNSVVVTPGAHVALPIDLEPGQTMAGADLSEAVAPDLTVPPPGSDLTVPAAAFTPTAPVTQGDVDNDPQLGDVTLAAGNTLINSDTGAISNGTTTIRAANGVFTTREVNNMIAFHTSAASGGVGIFSFRTLSIPAGATLKVVGTLPIALVSTTHLNVDGVILAQAMDINGNLCVFPADSAGGGAGGAAGITPEPDTTNGKPGGGLGGGAGGFAMAQGGPSSPAGGGGHAAAGGVSGSAVAGGTGVAGGKAYDTPNLSPYHGGSGGGGGGAAGANGGSGGGAVHLVAAQYITIGSASTAGGVNAGGCGGQTTGQTAGGGGSGGAILLESPTVQLGAKAVLAANGGGGAAANSSGNFNGANASFDDQAALGGDNPITEPTLFFGGNGGAGATIAGGTTNSNPGQYGGGGAAGIIRINCTGATPAITTGAILSPNQTTTVCTFGSLM